MAGVNYDWQGLLLVPLAIIVAACFLIPRMSRLDDWSFLSRILSAGLVLRLGFSMIVLYVSFHVYSDIDVSRYDFAGSAISQHIWRLEFNQVVPFLQWGTDSINLFTGVIYSIIGPTIIGGYLIYAFLGFLGSYFFYRAFRVAFPQGDRRLYAILVLFFPSILFWSNGIGKDALISLFIGLFAYGGAQLTKNRLQGFVPIALGLLGVMWIRPYIAAILALTFIIVFLVRGVGRGVARFVISIIWLLAFGGFLLFLMPQFMAFVGLKELSPAGVLSYLELRQSLTFGGGSAFQSLNISKPLNFPIIMATVFFRPLPWEAHNFQAMLQSLEGVILICLVLWRVKSLYKAVRALISNSYVRFILIYIIAFVIAYSSVQNFGILVRQRCMMLPFFFMLMAYAPSHARIENKAQEVAI